MHRIVTLTEPDRQNLPRWRKYTLLSRSTDTCFVKKLVKVEVHTKLLYSSKSNNVQVLKCTENEMNSWDNQLLS